MRKYRTKKGDAFFIPAGTVHSIGPSNIIFEIQQNSDITYRLYDWGRSNLGVQRELHIQKGVAAVRHAGLKVKPAGNVSRRDGVAVRKLADCPEFGAFEAVMEKGAKYWYSGPMPLVIGVIEGEVHIDYWTSGWRQKKGSVMLMPHKFGEFGIRAVKKSKLVLTEVR
jgi:mannose-6-phosphate isomerase